MQSPKSGGICPSNRTFYLTLLSLEQIACSSEGAASPHVGKNETIAGDNGNATTKYALAGI